jgi:hypothetical protein
VPIRYVARRAYLGRLNPTLADAAGLLQGTNTPPAARTGVIQTQLQPAVLSAVGGFTPSANRTGQIITSLDGGVGQFLGSFAGAGGSVLSHGAPFVVTGNNFGTNTSTYSFLGGSNSAGGASGTIEGTPVGVEVSDTVPSWNLEGETTGGVRGAKRGYNDATRGRVWTGDYGDGYPDVGALTYDTGSNIALGETVYATYWVYLTGLNAFSTGQVKLIRSVSIDDVTDGNTQLYISRQTGSLLVLANPLGQGAGGQTVFGDSSLLTQNNWVRVELIIEYPTSVNTTTGKATVRLHAGSNVPANIPFTFSSGATNNALNIYPTSTLSRRIIFQGYFGNGNTAGIIRQDDHYVQRGGRKRLELCNNANYSLSTVREIQPWTPGLWTNTSVPGRLNKGGFPSGPGWIHVVSDTDTSLGNLPVTVV